MASFQPRFDQIRIAIISPLAIELAAAQEILDEEYKDLAQAFPNDPNTYTVGRIGAHFVVVTGLPSGMTGIVSANNVAENVKRTFTSVKVLLLVGIGGGVPSPSHDIRLGDVVVSQPTGQYGGSIHYNFGKAQEGGRFEPSDFLNSPPQDILKAVNNLQARHLRGKTNLPAYIAHFQEGKQNGAFQYPGLEKDLLFKAGVEHVAGIGCENCKKSDCVQRDMRGAPAYSIQQNGDELPSYFPGIIGPVIHYGLIASGDQLMKDSMLRDRLNDSYGGQILCFEMEAAGLLNTYPCLVIRGISDYSDSHKRQDKAWHGWASAMAAAYAKDFINELPQDALSEGPAISDMVKDRNEIIFMCPYTENSDFIGRKAILEEIKKKLQHKNEKDGQASQTRKTIVLYGLGGVGKSQIAISYLYWLHGHMPDISIFWVHAASIERFHHGYRKIAEKFKIPKLDDPKTDILQLVKEWLQDEKNGKWFMVIDNADNTSDFFETGEDKMSKLSLEGSGGNRSLSKKLGAYLPQCAHGSILVTSRNKEAAVKFATKKGIIEVKSMNENESEALISSILTDDDYSEDELKQLCLLLGHLPLSLVQAAAFIEENSCGIGAYIEMYSESKDSALHLLSWRFETEGRDQDIPNAVAISWMLSFDQIRSRNPRAADLLSLMAFYDRQTIPESLLKDPDESSISFSQAIGQLLAYSLITRNVIKTQYDVHSLAHLISRAWQRRNMQEEKWRREAQERVLQHFPKNDYKRWDVCALYLPYAQALISEEMTKSLKVFNATIESLMRWVVTYLRDRAFHSMVDDLASQQLEYCKQHLGKENPSTLAVMDILALTYRDQARWKDAEELQQEALEIRKKTLGEEHPDTILSISNLASSYISQGRWVEAENMDAPNIKVMKRVLGEHDPTTIRAIGNLSLSYWNQGRRKEAVELAEQTMQVRKKLLGENHPRTLVSLNRLGNMYSLLGRWEEAQALMENMFEIRKNIIGPEHPDTLASGANLAAMYARQGHVTKGLETMKEIIGTMKKIMSEEHPLMLLSMANLGAMYGDMGSWKEAQKIGLYVLGMRKRLLGPDNHTTLLSMGYVAIAYRKQGKFVEAEELQIHVLEKMKSILGLSHQDTMDAMEKLAWTLKAEGKDKRAVEMMEDCHLLRSKELGEDHPETKICIKALSDWGLEENKQEASPQAPE